MQLNTKTRNKKY